MAKFRTGAASIKEAAESKGSSKFTPTLRWKAGDKKYIMFLQSIDEIPTVLYHNYIIVGHNDATNKPIYASFISRRDPALDGQDGYDELMDRFGETPKNRCIALAVELKPIFGEGAGRKKIVDWDLDTRKFTNKEGNEIEVPAVGLIIESPHTFYGYLSTFSDDKPIESEVFAVTRRGGGTDTAYDFVPVGDAPDIGDSLDSFFETFDFEAYLDELADEDRMREMIGKLPDDWTVNPYSKKGKGSSSSSTTQRSSRFKNEPQDEEVAQGSGPTEDEEGEEESGSVTQSRFSNLRKDFGSK